jgi:hypothetical protein
MTSARLATEFLDSPGDLQVTSAAPRCARSFEALSECRSLRAFDCFDEQGSRKNGFRLLGRLGQAAQSLARFGW